MPICSSEKRKEKGKKALRISSRIRLPLSRTDFDDEISGFGNRYARKAKTEGKAAVTELVHHRPSLGVHTRSQTLALKRLQRASPDTASCYLQLRSRCLEKHLPVPASARSRAATRNRPNADPNPKSNPSPAPVATRSPNRVNQAAGRGECPVNSDSVGSVPTKSNCFKKTKATAVAVREAAPEVNAAETGRPFGENVLELDSSRKVPSLVELCRDTAIANLRFMGDVGDVELHLLRDILPHCNIKELTHIENSTEGRDLSPVTDDLWKRFYERHFGKKNANAAINRMKQKKVAFKWRLLYEEKEKEVDESIKRAAIKIGAEIRASRGGKRQIQSRSEDPPSKKKRGHREAIGPDRIKSFLMKVAKMEHPNSHEVKIHALMRRNALQPSSLSHQSIPKQNSNPSK